MSVTYDKQWNSNTNKLTIVVLNFRTLNSRKCPISTYPLNVRSVCRHCCAVPLPDRRRNWNIRWCVRFSCAESFRKTESSNSTNGSRRKSLWPEKLRPVGRPAFFPLPRESFGPNTNRTSPVWTIPTLDCYYLVVMILLRWSEDSEVEVQCFRSTVIKKKIKKRNDTS